MGISGRRRRGSRQMTSSWLSKEGVVEGRLSCNGEESTLQVSSCCVGFPHTIIIVSVIIHYIGLSQSGKARRLREMGTGNFWKALSKGRDHHKHCTSFTWHYYHHEIIMEPAGRVYIKRID